LSAMEKDKPIHETRELCGGIGLCPVRPTELNSAV
jgi:hypothetical protein